MDWKKLTQYLGGKDTEDKKLSPYDPGRYPVADAMMKVAGLPYRPITSEESEDPAVKAVLGEQLDPLSHVGSLAQVGPIAKMALNRISKPAEVPGVVDKLLRHASDLRHPSLIPQYQKTENEVLGYLLGKKYGIDLNSPKGLEALDEAIRYGKDLPETVFLRQPEDMDRYLRRFSPAQRQVTESTVRNSFDPESRIMGQAWGSPRDRTSIGAIVDARRRSPESQAATTWHEQGHNAQNLAGSRGSNVDWDKAFDALRYPTEKSYGDVMDTASVLHHGLALPNPDKTIERLTLEHDLPDLDKLVNRENVITNAPPLLYIPQPPPLPGAQPGMNWKNLEDYLAKKK